MAVTCFHPPTVRQSPHRTSGDSNDGLEESVERSEDEDVYIACLDGTQPIVVSGEWR